MKKISLLLILLFVFAALPAMGYAASPWTEETGYPERMMGKFGFGLKNTLLGWTELIRQPIHHAREHEKPLIGTVQGLGVGIENAVVYTVGGILHLVTFPVTNLDVPLPHDGVECPAKKHSTE